MSDEPDILELVSNTEIFGPLELQYRKAITKILELRTYKPGKKIVSQGEEGEEFFLIVSGRVSVVVEDYALGVEQMILELEPGQSFGESAILTSERRSATVKAKEPTVCAALSRSAFQKLIEKIPAVSIAICRYLAGRLSAQCKLTGFRFLSGSDLVYEPKIYRAFSESVLRRCRAIPLSITGRTVTVALTAPNDAQTLKALQREVPGLSIEPVACTLEDYEAFLHRHRSRVPQEFGRTSSDEPLTVEREDGVRLGEPLAEILKSLDGRLSTPLILEWSPGQVQVLSKQNGSLEPFVPPLTGDRAKAFRQQIDEILRPGEGIGSRKESTLFVQGRPYQLEVSALKAWHKVRYFLKLRDIQSAVPPLRSLFCSSGSLDIVRTALHEPGSLLFVSGESRSGLTTTLYSMLYDRAENSDPRNMFLFEEQPLIPTDQILQLPLPRSLQPELQIATSQEPELIGFDTLRVDQLEDLLLQGPTMSTMVATYRGDDLLDTLATISSGKNGSPPSLHRIRLILNQRLIRRICGACCRQFEPSPEELKRLSESGLNNPQGEYFQGAGCEECGNSGVSGRVAVFEALACRRHLWESLAGLRTGQIAKERALRESYIFSFVDFTRLLIRQALVDPLEGLRLFPKSASAR